MVFRFQRRIHIAPGVRVNVSKSGLGLSIGPRGYSTSIGPLGVYRNVSIPGTGLSYRKKVGGNSGRASASGGGREIGSRQVSVQIHSDGTVHFLLLDGTDAPASLVRRVREENGEAIQRMISVAIEKFNADLSACLSIHLGTPPPDYQPLTVLTPPPEKPSCPTLRSIGFLDKLLGQRGRIEAANAAIEESFALEMKAWSTAIDEHKTLEADTERLNERVRAGDPDAQEKVLKRQLSEISWAKPTDVSFDFGVDASTVHIDVDLPTIDELPEREAIAPARGLNVRWKARSTTQRRKDFCYLAHAAIFRVVGESFACLPNVQKATVSGYTQRPDKATGNTVDQYILSVRVSREEWRVIDFDRLDAVEVEHSLDRFELVRSLTRGGELREIEPLAVEV